VDYFNFTDTFPWLSPFSTFWQTAFFSNAELSIGEFVGLLAIIPFIWKLFIGALFFWKKKGGAR